MSDDCARKVKKPSINKAKYAPAGMKFMCGSTMDTYVQAMSDEKRKALINGCRGDYALAIARQRVSLMDAW
jgi:hypothetical protein